MMKLSDNPPILYPEKIPLEDINKGCWWVAHTKSRNEKSLAWSLHKWEIPFFLPLVSHVSRNRGRVLKSLVPLFKGYLFFNGDDEDRYKALTTNRIANVIPVANQPVLITELASIHKAISCDAPIDPHPYLKEGVRCRVKAGALMGLEGIVIHKKNITRIVINVEMLGQAAAVEIDSDLLESVEP